MKIITVAILTIALSASISFASYENIIAEIKSISMNGGIAIVTVIDVKNQKEVKVTVKDNLTLEKFKDRRIVEGAEVRIKYDTSSGVSMSFLMRAGM